MEESNVDFRNIMKKKETIRNVCVISHMRHGKSTLVDWLAGVIDQDITRADEAERGITTKANSISLCYETSDKALKDHIGVREGNEYLIHLIDTPGHVDFFSEVTASLRITDGALVVVDCIDGVRVQTKTVLRQALEEQIWPVLSVNKIDKFFLDQVDGETAYQKLQKVIENVNVIISCEGGKHD